MTARTIDRTLPAQARSGPGRLTTLARRGLLARLARITTGRLILQDGASRHEFGSATDDSGLRATIRVRNPRFYGDIAFGGSVGAGESYMRGDWECDELTSLVRLLLRNRHVLDDMDGSITRLRAPLYRAFHWLNRNTRDGSRRNIHAHYDLGNDLFALFLDENMMYSCAVYEHESDTLDMASAAKLDRICRKLRISPNDHVLEIGTGWGGFAIHAARRYGCRVTTTTISREQYQFATERVREAGLSGRITVLQQDYRDLRGHFDKLVSIEMIEAIGAGFQDTFFRACAELLRPDGMMLLQAITIADQRYQAALRDVDFIQRYIFPGSFIPAVAPMLDSVARASDMRVFHLEDIGPHYARTLREWRERFFDKLDAVRALGYPDEFVRMWEFYLCYCEGGFEERALGDVQMLLVKPEARVAPITPPL